MSLYKHKYVDTPNTNLICSICNAPFTDPTTARTCLHTFCHECILQALSKWPLCPIDRSPLAVADLGAANPIVRSLVDELFVECIHRSQGCFRTCQRQLLALHLEDECEYAEVGCTVMGCGEVMWRKDVQGHVEQVHGSDVEDGRDDLKEEGGGEESYECPHATVGCAYKGPFKPSEHLPSCPYESLKEFIALITAKLEVLTEENVMLRHRVDVLEGSAIRATSTGVPTAVPKTILAESVPAPVQQNSTLVPTANSQPPKSQSLTTVEDVEDDNTKRVMAKSASAPVQPKSTPGPTADIQSPKSQSLVVVEDDDAKKSAAAPVQPTSTPVPTTNTQPLKNQILATVKDVGNDGLPTTSPKKKKPRTKKKVASSDIPPTSPSPYFLFMDSKAPSSRTTLHDTTPSFMASTASLTHPDPTLEPHMLNSFDRRTTLRSELDSIRDRQSSDKDARGKSLNQIKAIQYGIQKKDKDLQAAKGKIPFNNVAELDAHIKNLEKLVESGNMKLADEKRALQEISSTKRNRRLVEGFQADQESIKADRQKIDDLRKELNDPDAKTISELYDAIKAELDELKESEEAYVGRSKLFEERDDIQSQLKTVFDEKREPRQHYWTKFNEDRARRAERARKKDITERLLAEAQMPAFQAQIEDCQTLVDYLSGKSTGNVSYKSTPAAAEKTEVAGVPKLELRKVEEAPEGLVARKKKGEEDESYFVAAKGKKDKKTTPKANDSTPAAETKEITAKDTTSLNIPLPTLSALLSLYIPPPASSADVPRVIEDLNTKMAWFEANQDLVTAENVAKAQAEIQRLSKGPSS